MTNITYSKILAKEWEIVALIIGVTVVLSLIFCLIQPFEYGAKTRVLVIQKQVNSIDPYTAAKAAERIAKDLGGATQTSDFYNAVLEDNPQLKSKFSADPVNMKKEWAQEVAYNVTPETGFLEITAYDRNKEMAAELVKAVAATLVAKAPEYHGAGKDVEVKVVDDVFVGNYPARPNVIVNISLAAILGAIFGAIYVILFEAKNVERKRIVRELANNANRFNANDANRAADKRVIIEASAEDIADILPAEAAEDLEEAPQNIEDEKPHFILDNGRKTYIRTMHDHLAI